MFGSTNCPRCFQSISQERQNAIPVVCNSCGHVLSGSQKSTEEKLERTTLYSIIGASLFMLGTFMHVASWGGASLEVIAFKAGELIGSNSTESIEHMSQVCLEQKKFECTEKMYRRLARTDVNQAARLGKFQVSQRKFKEASETFRTYFANGGHDLEVNYLFAKSLGETGQIDEASKHFDLVLDAKPNVLQITVMQNYVKYLVNHNRLDQAKAVIQKIRNRDQTVSSFMDAELKIINEKLGSAS